MSTQEWHLRQLIEVTQPYQSQRFMVLVDGQALTTARGAKRLFQVRERALQAGRREARRRWLEVPYEQNTTPPANCPQCGAALAHIVGGSVHAVVCPGCEPERLAELEDELPELAAATEEPEQPAPVLDFRPETYVAPSTNGKYVINVVYEGRPIGHTAERYTKTQFLPYFHPRAPAKGEPVCTFLQRGLQPGCGTLEQAIARCQEHAADEQLAHAPTAPGADT
jgi:hypothetical protein